MLKAELHVHVKGDSVDRIPYTPEELIDAAAEKGFEVVALTSHNIVIYNKELADYAGKKNILLIPGVERTVKGKHVLIYNLTEEESQKIDSLESLERLKQEKKDKNIPFLVIAPHPYFYGFSCLGNKVIKHLDLFDAWECSFFFTTIFNRNKKAIRLSKKYQKPLVGNSDVHQLNILGRTCTLIDAEKNIGSVFEAIRKNKVEIRGKPLPLFRFCCFFVWFSINKLFKNLRQKRNLRYKTL